MGPGSAKAWLAEGVCGGGPLDLRSIPCRHADGSHIHWCTFLLAGAADLPLRTTVHPPPSYIQVPASTASQPDPAREFDHFHPAIHGKPTVSLLKEVAMRECFRHEGFTSLMIAAYLQEDQIVRQLLEEGASPFDKDRQGRTALWWGIVGSGIGREAFLKDGRTPDALELLGRYSAQQEVKENGKGKEKEEEEEKEEQDLQWQDPFYVETAEEKEANRRLQERHGDLTAEDVLREAVSCFEEEVLPTVRRRVKQVAQLFNHDELKDYVIGFGVDDLKHIEQAGESGVFHLFRALKEAVQEHNLHIFLMPETLIASCTTNSAAFAFFQEADLDGLFDTEKAAGDRARDFVDRVQAFLLKSRDEANEEALQRYLESYKNIGHRKFDPEIAKKDFEEGRKAIDEQYESFTAWVRESFGPLEQQLKEGRKEVIKGSRIAGLGTLIAGLGITAMAPIALPAVIVLAGASVGAGSATSYAVQSRYPRTHPSWFPRVVDFFCAYVRGEKNDGELKSFIQEEEFEEDIDIFRERFRDWIRQAEAKLRRFRQIYINIPALELEIQRGWAFVKYLLLKTKELETEYESLLQRLQQNAELSESRDTLCYLLPSVSLGRLERDPESGLYFMKFVLGTDCSLEDKEKVINFFENQWRK